jgi:chromosomal replication initiation ATPase DnaA
MTVPPPPSHRQIPLDLPVRTALGAEDFVVSASNRDAVAWLDRWPDWPGPALAIYGPEGCGKSHLAHVWQARSRARFLDAATPDGPPPAAHLILDETRLPEERLFHLYNHVKAAAGSLLILSREAPARWPVHLPDLASRLASIPAIAVAAPDDALLAAVLAKHFADRQLAVGADVIDHLARHIERSFAAAAETAAALDSAALAQQRRPSLALAREVLKQLGH